MLAGAALPIANGAPLFMRAYPDQKSFLAANGMSVPSSVGEARELVSATPVSAPDGLEVFDQ